MQWFNSHSSEGPCFSRRSSELCISYGHRQEVKHHQHRSKIIRLVRSKDQELLGTPLHPRSASSAGVKTVKGDTTGFFCSFAIFLKTIFFWKELKMKQASEDSSRSCGTRLSSLRTLIAAKLGDRSRAPMGGRDERREENVCGCGEREGSRELCDLLRDPSP